MNVPSGAPDGFDTVRSDIWLLFMDGNVGRPPLGVVAYMLASYPVPVAPFQMSNTDGPWLNSGRLAHQPVRGDGRGAFASSGGIYLPPPGTIVVPGGGGNCGGWFTCVAGANASIDGKPIIRRIWCIVGSVVAFGGLRPVPIGLGGGTIVVMTRSTLGSSDIYVVYSHSRLSTTPLYFYHNPMARQLT